MYPNAYALAPSNAGTNHGRPFELCIAEVKVQANVEFTATIWVKKTNADASYETRFLLPGGQLSGIPDDVSDDAADTTDWQQLSITATPTEAGVLEFYIQTWGSSTYATHLDDFAINGVPCPLDASNDGAPWARIDMGLVGSAADIREGTVIAGQVGTLAVPSADDVIEGVPVDDTVGTYHEAETSEVKAGVHFGPSSSYEGTYEGGGGGGCVIGSSVIVPGEPV